MLNQTILDNLAKKLELREPNRQAVQAFLTITTKLKAKIQKTWLNTFSR